MKNTIRDGRLKPCPFCGQEPVINVRASDVTLTREFWTIACYCGGYCATAIRHGNTITEVFDLWNTRHK